MNSIWSIQWGSDILHNMTIEFFTITGGFLGLIIGSFLNVVIARADTNNSPFSGRSQCPNCSHTLGALDLIPVVSFLLLRRKCRYCKKKISWQYPLVEMLTAFVFASVIFSYLEVGASALNILTTVCLLGVFCVLIVILVYDILHYIILDAMLVLLMGFVILFHTFSFIEQGSVSAQDIGVLVIAGIIPCLMFFGFFFISQGKWMGFGDVKFVFIMGLLLGFPNILVALFIAFISGAIIGVALVGLHNKHIKDKVPFAPFLLIGLCIAFWFGDHIVDWYKDITLL